MRLRVLVSKRSIRQGVLLWPCPYSHRQVLLYFCSEESMQGDTPEHSKYSVIHPHRSSNGPPEHHRVPTGCNGGRLTSCPWSIESGCGSVDSTSVVASRWFSP